MQWLREVDAPWWIAGGHAIDLFSGRTTRAHGDVDVGCFRADLTLLRAALEGWSVFAAHAGRLARLRADASPGPEVHSVWCRPEGASVWWLEILLDEREGEDWVYRRCLRVRHPAREVVLRDAAALQGEAPQAARASTWCIAAPGSSSGSLQRRDFDFDLHARICETRGDHHGGRAHLAEMFA